jgi:hypothetical protein
MVFKQGHTINIGRKDSEETRKRKSLSHKGLKPQSWGAGFKTGNKPWNHKDFTYKAYYAGLFDGEGYVGIIGSGITFKDKNYKRVVVCIAMKASDSELILKEAQARWGGSLHYRQPRKSNHSLVLEWRIYTKQANVFLRDILPFLRIKQEQVDIALQYRDLQTRKRSGTNRISDDEWSLRDSIEKKHKELHHT